MRIMSTSDKALLGIGVLCMLATIVIVLLVCPPMTPMAFVAMFGLIWAELVLFGGMYFLRRYASPEPSIFVRVGGSFVILVFAIAAFAVSSVFFPLSSLLIPQFFAVQVMLAALLVCIILVILFLEKRFRASDRAVSAGISYVTKRSAQISACARMCADPDVKQRLERCADDLKFMDSTIQVQADFEIDERVESIRSDLEACRSESFDSAQLMTALSAEVRELELAIAARKDDAAVAKRGGF